VFSIGIAFKDQATYLTTVTGRSLGLHGEGAWTYMAMIGTIYVDSGVFEAWIDSDWLQHY